MEYSRLRGGGSTQMCLGGWRLEALNHFASEHDDSQKTNSDKLKVLSTPCSVSPVSDTSHQLQL